MTCEKEKRPGRRPQEEPGEGQAEEMVRSSRVGEDSREGTSLCGGHFGETDRHRCREGRRNDKLSFDLDVGGVSVAAQHGSMDGEDAQSPDRGGAE